MRKRLTKRGIELSAVMVTLSAASTAPLSARHIDSIVDMLNVTPSQIPVSVSTLLAGRLSTSWLAVAATVVVAIVGGGLLAVPNAKPISPIEPNRTFVAAPVPKVKDDEPPLPEGAVARIGSTRMRMNNDCSWLGFTRDGQSLLSLESSMFHQDNAGMRVWDLST